MTQHEIPNAVCFPQDAGSGISGQLDGSSAYLLGKLASHVEGSYVDTEENPNSLAFSNIDIANDTADIENGTCYIIDDSSATDNKRNDATGDPTLQSTRTSGFDTPAPTRQPYVVIVPGSVTEISLDTDAVNDIYISINPTAQNDVTLHYGSSISAPSEPSVKLGTIDTSDGSTTRPNDAWSFDGQNVAELTNLAAVETDSATIGSGDRISQMAFGRTSVLDAGTSSTDDASDYATATEEVSFSTDFETTPNIYTEMDTGNRYWLDSGAYNLSPTGFTAVLSNISSSAPSTTARVIWFAVL